MLALPRTTAQGAPACCRHQLPRLLAPILLLLLAGCLRNDPPGLYLADTSPPDTGQPGESAEGEGAEGEGAEGEGAEGEGAEGEGAEGEGAEGEGEGKGAEGEGAEGEGAEGEGGEGEGATVVCSGQEVTPPCNGCPVGTIVPDGWVCVPAGTFTMVSYLTIPARASHAWFPGTFRKGAPVAASSSTRGRRGQGRASAARGLPLTPPTPVHNRPEGRPPRGCRSWDVPGPLPETTCAKIAVQDTMGSPAGEAGNDVNETQHEATITRPFLMQSTEVTQGEWLARMGTTPSFFAACGDDCPVEQVSWYEAVTYCNALSTAEGLAVCYTDPADGTAYVLADASASKVPVWSGPGCRGYRLPTEAEWELAARAGTTTATYGGDLDATYLDCEQPNDALDDLAWFCGNAESTPHPVATKYPNVWGLYDVLGNTWEWCWDRFAAYPVDPPDDYTGSNVGALRMARGGSWDSTARSVRAALRGLADPAYRDSRLGFRPVRSVPDP